jgi:hypothetical protein
MSALLFVDTETTGLDPEDHIWEAAFTRRGLDGTETTHQTFVQHDVSKAERLPPSFLTDYRARYDPASAIAPASLATLVQLLTQDRPHVIGAVPNFDTERLERLVRYYGVVPGWHYHLIDVENLAIGWLRGRLSTTSRTRGASYDRLVELTTPPYDSDELSRACGIEPPGEGVRHTAMGDVRWGLALYDRIMGVS